MKFGLCLTSLLISWNIWFCHASYGQAEDVVTSTTDSIQFDSDMSSGKITTPEDMNARIKRQKLSADKAWKADKLYAKGDIAGAKALYKESLDLDPTNGQGLSGMGYILEKEGKTSEARADLHKALYYREPDMEHISQDVTLRMHYVLTLLSPNSSGVIGDNVSVASPEAQGMVPWKDWKEAAALYEDTIYLVVPDAYSVPEPSTYSRFITNERHVLEPQAMTHVLLGVELYGRAGLPHENAACVSEFEAAIKIQPNLALAHYWLGRVFVDKMQDKVAEAKAEFTCAAKLGRGSVRDAAEKQLPAFEPWGYNRYAVHCDVPSSDTPNVSNPAGPPMEP